MPSPSAPPRRRRPPPRPVEVLSTGLVTPRLRTVLLGGPALVGFRVEIPAAHIKIAFPEPGGSLPEVGPDGWVLGPGGQRPPMRTYTPRRHDERAGTVEVQFVLHGDGLGSGWAEEAKPGDGVAIGGPGGRFTLDLTADRWWIAGDESALPAIATILEALPPTASAEVHVEVDGDEDELALPSPATTTLSWHHRDDPTGWGAGLEAAAGVASIAPGTQVWVACEAAVVRRIRRHLLVDLGLPRETVTTRGYWKLGEVDHPDHDHGEDA